MPITMVPNVDQRAVVRLERIARVEVGHAVGADHLPVGAAGQHAARQALAGEAPAGDVDDASPAERRVAELLRRGEGDLSLEERLELQALSGPGKVRGRRAAACSLSALSWYFESGCAASADPRRDARRRRR